MSMRKTYHIRKVQGGGVSTIALKKKKRVLVSFPHSATPLTTTLGGAKCKKNEFTSDFKAGSSGPDKFLEIGAGRSRNGQKPAKSVRTGNRKFGYFGIRHFGEMSGVLSIDMSLAVTAITYKIDRLWLSFLPSFSLPYSLIHVLELFLPRVSENPLYTSEQQ